MPAAANANQIRTPSLSGKLGTEWSAQWACLLGSSKSETLH